MVHHPSIPDYDVHLTKGIYIVMSDGTKLAADVYRPAIDGNPLSERFPAILETTPYNRGRVDLHRMGHFFASRGYAVVTVDSRGRHDSEGEFRFFFAEPHEGHDLANIIEWIASQEWSDGNVGTTGLSFSGNNQQAAAILAPEHLKTTIVLDAGYKYWQRTFRHGGTFADGILFPYALWMALGDRQVAADPIATRCLREALSNIDQWIRRLPVRRGNSPLAIAPSYERWYFEMQETTDFEGIWCGPMANIEAYMDDWADIPTLLVTSWYGHHAWANFEKWRKLQRPGRKNPAKLLVGTWLHAFEYTSQAFAGDVEFGPAVSLDQNDLCLRWFDEHLKGVENGIVPTAPIRMFVMGGGQGRMLSSGRIDHGGDWRSFESLPVGGPSERILYLHSDGSLQESQPDSRIQSTDYVFNPADPVPTVGGSLQNPLGKTEKTFIRGGGFDQRGRSDLTTCVDTLPLSARHDVCVFRTESLAAPLEIVGETTVKLWVSTSGNDTDFTVKVIDEYPPSHDYPEGFALNIADTIVRLRYRGGAHKALEVEPDTVYEVELGPLAFANRFEAGHRLRLDVSSSNWPLYDVNSNLGRALHAMRGGIPVLNRIFHSKECSSHIKLPVLKSEV